MDCIFDIKYWEKFSIKSYEGINKYLEFIKSILELGDRNLDYSECHHIVPKSFNQNIDTTIRLTAEEHCISHEILANCFKGMYGRKMIYALNRIRHSPDLNCRISSELYERLKVLYSIKLSDCYSGSGNPFYGKRHSEESKRKISEGRKLYFKNITNEDYEKYCISKRKENLSEEAIRNIKRGQIGNKNRLGKPTSEETIRKISRILSDGRMKGKNVGSKLESKMWINDGISNRRVKEEELERYLSNGYIRGRISSKTRFGRVCINKDESIKFVHKTDLDSYINSGWTIGKGNIKCKKESLADEVED